MKRPLEYATRFAAAAITAVERVQVTDRATAAGVQTAKRHLKAAAHEIAVLEHNEKEKDG